jgi:hypothetical protein
MGSKSVKFHAQGFSSGPSDAIGAYNAFSSDGNDKWIRAYVRWNLISGGWPAIAIKMLYDLKGYYYEPSFSGNGGLPVNMLYKHDAASNQVPIPSGQLQNNRWYEVEVHWKKSSPPKFEAWIDNVQIVNVTPGTADPSLYVLFGMINIQGTQSNFSLDHWIDGLAVGTSRIYPASTIEISNSATYGSGTRVYQQPVYLSDGSVQIKVNLTGLGSGPYYLWITNNSQARSTAYQLTGGAPTAAAPLPPTITSIQ